MLSKWAMDDHFHYYCKWRANEQQGEGGSHQPVIVLLFCYSIDWSDVIDVGTCNFWERWPWVWIWHGDPDGVLRLGLDGKFAREQTTWYDLLYVYIYNYIYIFFDRTYSLQTFGMRPFWYIKWSFLGHDFEAWFILRILVGNCDDHSFMSGGDGRAPDKAPSGWHCKSVQYIYCTGQTHWCILIHFMCMECHALFGLFGGLVGSLLIWWVSWLYSWFVVGQNDTIFFILYDFRYTFCFPSHWWCW